MRIQIEKTQADMILSEEIQHSGQEEKIMRIIKAGLAFVLVLCVLMISGCGGGTSTTEEMPDDMMIGPRSKEAWKRWDEQQEALKKTWGETDVYAYVKTIMDDMRSIRAYVVFGEDFSVETESEERDALMKFYNDANFSEEIPLEEFIRMLEDSELQFAIGTMLDLDSIKERKEEDGGGYDVTLLYYPTPDALMPVDLRITTDDSGKFSIEESFPKNQES